LLELLAGLTYSSAYEVFTLRADIAVTLFVRGVGLDSNFGIVVNALVLLGWLAPGVGVSRGVGRGVGVNTTESGHHYNGEQ
jgi:hypothetical protein